MTTLLNKKIEQKVKIAAGELGISESEVVDRALSMFLVAQQDAEMTLLRVEMSAWQGLGFESLRRFEESIGTDYQY